MVHTSPSGNISIESGYVPGLLGRCIELHALYYAASSGFGAKFETGVAGGLAAFIPRLDGGRSMIWRAMQNRRIVGTIAIDGEDLGPESAHLRWFIVDDAARGKGIGRRLLVAALGFVDGNDFQETRLWTFRGLDAARKLYEEHGFILVKEEPGDRWGTRVMEQEFVRRKR